VVDDDDPHCPGDYHIIPITAEKEEVKEEDNAILVDKEEDQ
jgi:hypothetical protein